MTRRRDHNDEETKTGAPTETGGTIVIKETEGMPLEELERWLGPNLNYLPERLSVTV